MSHPELQPGLGPSQEEQATFIVDVLGRVETPESKIPRIVIHREQLSPQRPEISIGLESVECLSGDSILFVVFQEFGLPFRTITIKQIFEREGGDGEEEAFYIPPTKAHKLALSCPSYGWNKVTQRYIDGRDFDDGDVMLQAGEQVVFAHDGKSADFRTGFIQNDASIVVFKDDWRIPGETGHFDEYTPLIGITYQGTHLTLKTYDEVTADVIFEKKVSQADEAVTREPLTTTEFPDETTVLEIINVLQGILAPTQTQILTEVARGIQSLSAENATLRERLQDDKARQQVLEVTNGRIKQRLINTQEELQKALFENQQLKREAGGATRSDPFSGLGTEKTGSNANDPYGYCGTLRIDPDRLLNTLPPDVAQRVVQGLRRVYSTIYHPDKPENAHIDPSLLKGINHAADRILDRIRTGSWGRN